MTSYGSMIPTIQKRINFFSSLLPLTSGITFLKQKQYIEKKIKLLKAEIRYEEIQELLES